MLVDDVNVVNIGMQCYFEREREREREMEYIVMM